jgi:probable O-glycosylation ligase (exosortase A-associated)
MRDLMMLGAMLFMVPISISSAFGAYLLWEWTAVLSPSYYLFGFMQSVRYNLIFAFVSIGLLLLGRLTDRGSLRITITSAAVLLFLLHSALSAAFALSPNPLNEDLFILLVKAMVFCLLMPAFVTNRTRVHALLVMLALGLGFHGTVEGLKVLVTGGAHKPIGVATSMMSDNNHFAVAVVMILPLLFYLFRYSKKRLAQLGFLGVFGLSVISVIGTQSRGGFIALVLAGSWLILSSRHKVLLSVLVLCLAGVVAVSAPASWFERVQTIESADKDASFLARVAAWRVSTAVGLDNPVFGAGFHAIQVQWIWETYRGAGNRIGTSNEEITESARAAHSIYFEILGDQGILGLLMFLSLFLVAAANIRAAKKIGARHRVELSWGTDLIVAIGVSLFAYAVGGAGVSLGYFEFFYVLVLLTEVLKQVIEREALALDALSGPAVRPAAGRPAGRVSP